MIAVQACYNFIRLRKSDKRTKILMIFLFLDRSLLRQTLQFEVNMALVSPNWSKKCAKAFIFCCFLLTSSQINIAFVSWVSSSSYFMDVTENLIHIWVVIVYGDTTNSNSRLLYLCLCSTQEFFDVMSKLIAWESKIEWTASTVTLRELESSHSPLLTVSLPLKEVGVELIDDRCIAVLPLIEG